MRARYEEQLEKLNVEMILMGGMCEDAINNAMLALVNMDQPALRDKVYSITTEINQKKRDVELLCTKLLIQQQPVAGDLRLISAAMRMISDMERIGDQAADIAEIIGFITDKNVTQKIPIHDMGMEAVKMVTDSIDSFVKRNETLARSTIEYDDVVDNYFREIRFELIQLIASDTPNCEFYIDLLMIAKYLERIGDHAVNIAEWVLYAKGEHL